MAPSVTWCCASSGRRHASPAGTYLAACLFFRILTGKSPEGLPARIVAGGTVLADLVAEQAAALQIIAADLG